MLTGLGERDANNPEGAGLDLRLGRLAHLTGGGHLGVTRRHTPEATPLKPDDDDTYVLRPQSYYVATTIEVLHMPADVAALVVARSTLYRSAVMLSAGLVAPGYSGEISVGLYNAGDSHFLIEPGARFIHLTFMSVEGASSIYRGQWQGGRIDAPESEEQV
ncbi:dCTP deaminase [Gordonia terrae]